MKNDIRPLFPLKKRFRPCKFILCAGIALLVLTLLLPDAAKAQNLVPNPSFEENQGCPGGFGNLSVATAWFSPTDGTPEYFNTCSTAGSVGVPNNWLGSQTALSDTSYAGFYAFAPDNVREYLAVKLSQPLQNGEAYCVSFNLSRADFTYIAVGGIGAYFSTDSVGVLNGSQPLNFTPQVQHQGSPIANDDDWTSVTGTFEADGNYGWLIIGNFADNANTDTTDLSIPGAEGPFSQQGYYYADEISVTQLQSLQITSDNASNLACEGETFTLRASGGDAYEWVNTDDPFTVLSNADTLAFIALQNTQIVLTANNGSCSRTQTFDIEVVTDAQPNFAFHAACVGFPVNFTDQSANINENALYEWDLNGDGTTDATTLGGASYVFDAPGDYSAKLTVFNNAACVADTTILVNISEDCDPCVQTLNLVANPSMEIYNQCPDELGQIEPAQSWLQATDGTTDFHHQCAGNNVTGVPKNAFGFQEAADGNAYLGFNAYGPLNYREYASVPLVQAVLPGNTYCVSFSVSHADATAIAIDQIGAYFSRDTIAVNTQSPLYLQPQITNSSGNILSDSEGWTSISGVFEATDTLNWLTIGNFFDNAGTDTLTISGDGITIEDFAYYYLDEVSVTPVPSLQLPETEIDVCVGTEQSISMGGAFCSQRWYELAAPDDTLSTDTLFFVKSETIGSTTIVVEATVGFCTQTDTLRINYINLPQPDFEVFENCAGAVTAFIDASANVSGNATYEWDFDNDGNFDASGAGVAGNIYETPGNYDVRLQITNADGCQNDTLIAISIAENCDPCAGENDLALNGGFEQQVCPDSLGLIYNANLWSAPDSMQAGNLFSSCAEFDAFGVPANQFGAENARQDSSYAGFYAYVQSGGRNYLNGQLGLPLDSGTVYCVKFFVSLADSSDFAADAISLYFSSQPLNTDLNLHQTPQINQPQFSIIDEKEGWTAIGTTFEADSAYQYFSIGNFAELGSFNLSATGTGDGSGYAYYFVDEVSVSPMRVQLPDDAEICAGESLQLNAQTNTCDNYWYESGSPSVVLSTDTLLNITPETTTVYVFAASNGACVITDSVTVTVKPPPTVTVTPDFSICIGDSAQLEVTGGHLYEWSPNVAINDTTAAKPWVMPSETSIYNVLVTDTLTHCQSEAAVQVTVNPLPIADAGLDSTICFGNSIRLSGSGGDIYHWEPPIGLSNPGLPDPLTTPDVTTTFYLTVTDSQTGCSASDSVVITVQQPYQIPDTTFYDLCAGDAILLDLSDVPDDAISYQWQPTDGLLNPNQREATAAPLSDVIYTVTYTDAFGCEGMASAAVNVSTLPDAGPDQFICGSGQVQLTASGGGIAYAWSPSTGLNDTTLANPIASPNQTTVYYVEVTYENDPLGCVSMDSVTVSVIAEGFADAGNNVTICAGDTVQLQAIGGDVYNWTPTDSILNANTATPLVFPSETTIYTVEVGNTQTGCTALDSVRVTIKEAEAPFIASEDSLAFCVQPFETLGHCISLLYDGCENLTTEVITQLGSQVNVVSNSCFTYESAFATERSDTVLVRVCTEESGLCDSTRLILVNCDLPPTWSADTVYVETYLNFPLNLNVIATDPDGADDELQFAADIALGSVSIDNVNGNIFYYPPEDYVGADTILLYVCDSFYPVECDEFVAYVNVLPNNPPIIQDNSFTTFSGTSEITCFGVTEPEGQDLTYSIVTQATSGELTYEFGNCFNYLSEPSFEGLDSAFVAVCDPYGLCDTAVVTITVILNLPPDAADLSVEVISEAETEVCLNVTEPDGDGFTPFFVHPPTNGAVGFSNDTCFNYLSNTGFTGSDSLSIAFCDPFGKCDTAWVYIWVTPSNYAPMVNDTILTIGFETTSALCVKASDPDGDDLVVGIVENVSFGNLQIINDSCVTYIAAVGYVGNDTALLSVCDPAGLCDSAMVVWQVLPPVNQPPTIEDETTNITVDQNITICPTLSDPEGETLTLEFIQGALNGTAEITDDTCIFYQPNPGFVGTESLLVSACDPSGQCGAATITINVLVPMNLPPNVADAFENVPHETQVSICLNVVEPEGQPYTITQVSDPPNGAAVMSTFECLTYLPNLGFSGLDSLFVIVCDPMAACDTAWVYLTVAPPDNLPPTVSGNNFTVTAGVNAINCLDISDPEGGFAFINDVGIASNGAANELNNNCFTYEAFPAFTGIDSVLVNVCDGEAACVQLYAYFEVLPNQAPQVDDITQNLLIGETIQFCPDVTEPENENYTLSIINAPANGGMGFQNDTCIIYTPNAGFIGTDQAEVAICDIYGNCTNIIITLNVADETNLPPNVQTPALTAINGGTSETVCLTASDPNGDVLTYQVVSVTPAVGIADIDNAGCLTYDASISTSGVVDVLAAVCDDESPALCTEVTVSFLVNAAPLTNSQTASTLQNQSVAICPDVSDAEDDDWNLMPQSVPSNGSVSFGDTCLTFTPNATFIGSETFSVQVCDTNGACSTFEVTVNVADGLVAETDIVEAEDGIALEIDVTNNDLFPNAGDLTINVTENPTSGTAVVTADGISYTSPDGFTGLVNFVYEICDPVLGCDTAMVNLEVVNLLDAIDDEVTTVENENIVIDVLSNDVFPDLTNLSILPEEGVAHGAVSFNTTTNEFTYIPDAGYVGVDTFYYRIEYPGRGFDVGMVVINVVAEPQAPAAVDDEASTLAGEEIIITVLDNDSFEANYTVKIIELPDVGTLVLNDDNTFTYTPPDEDYSGTVTFTYELCNAVSGLCDVATVTLQVEAIPECELTIFAAISPNGDNKNDRWEIENMECAGYEVNALYVYNRWGNIVYEAENYGANGNWWDGTNQKTGKAVPDGTYYYILKNMADGSERKGAVEVWR